MKKIFFLSLLFVPAFTFVTAQDSLKTKESENSFIEPLLNYQDEMDSSSLEILRFTEAWGDGCDHSHVCCEVQCYCCQRGFTKKKKKKKK